MKSLIIPITKLSVLKVVLSTQATGAKFKETELKPVENAELFDHLFIHDDRKFSREINQYYSAA
jgi:hypothetical protein